MNNTEKKYVVCGRRKRYRAVNFRFDEDELNRINNLLLKINSNKTKAMLELMNYLENHDGLGLFKR